MEVQGFVIESMEQGVAYASGVATCAVDGNTCTFFKPPTARPAPFLWLGHRVAAASRHLRIQFDALFHAKVPTPTDGFGLKTHAPVGIHTAWLAECRADEWCPVSLVVPAVPGEEQLVIWIADDHLPALRVSLRNVTYSAGTGPIIHFLSFYTQGPPHDHGLCLDNCRRTLEAATRPFFDTTTFVSAAELAADPATRHLVHHFPIAAPCNPLTHTIGFLRWKPYIILQALRRAADGDVVFYRDVNSQKYPEILADMPHISATLAVVLRRHDLFVPTDDYPNLKIKHNVKREVVDALGPPDATVLLETPLFNASLIAARKTPETLRFMQEWLDLCMNDDLLTSDCDKSRQHPDFLWNTQEQALLNMHLWRWGHAPNFSGHGRHFSAPLLRRVPRVAVLLAGEMRNFVHTDVLACNRRHLFDRLNADIFVSTWSHRGWSFGHGHNAETPYSKATVTEEDVVACYGPRVKAVHVESFDDWRRDVLDAQGNRLFEQGFYNGENRCPATCFPQLYKIWDANRLKRAHEVTMGVAYDIVIRFRPDVALLEPIPAEHLNPLLVADAPPPKAIWHMNPPKIHYPDRVYDIFFYGTSAAMDCVADAWPAVHDLIAHPFNNGLSAVDCCRLLYIQARIINGYDVVDIRRCLGDIYRDEPFSEYVQKITRQFN